MKESKRICVYVYVHVCVYVDVRVCMYIILNMCVCVCVFATVHYYTSHACMHVLIYHFKLEYNSECKYVQCKYVPVKM